MTTDASLLVADFTISVYNSSWKYLFFGSFAFSGLYEVNTRSAFIFAPGSRSAFNMRIRIQEGKFFQVKTEKC